jgi:hypothetical protein
MCRQHTTPTLFLWDWPCLCDTTLVRMGLYPSSCSTDTTCSSETDLVSVRLTLSLWDSPCLCETQLVSVGTCSCETAIYKTTCSYETCLCDTNIVQKHYLSLWELVSVIRTQIRLIFSVSMDVSDFDGGLYWHRPNRYH